jgi:regulator of telomere elongation helicase 1
LVGSDGSSEDKKLINKIASYYKVHVKVDNIKGRILCYWCLSPGYSMQELLAEGARCIILTSGTLSPISTFKEDMKIPFDITLENPHIIKETQIKVLSLSKGPDNIVLSSKYTNRENDNYLQSLGQLVINFAKILPHGLLVFFPSYKALESATDFWRVNKIGIKMKHNL